MKDEKRRPRARFRRTSKDNRLNFKLTPFNFVSFERRRGIFSKIDLLTHFLLYVPLTCPPYVSPIHVSPTYFSCTFLSASLPHLLTRIIYIYFLYHDVSVHGSSFFSLNILLEKCRRRLTQKRFIEVCFQYVNSNKEFDTKKIASARQEATFPVYTY